MRQTETLETVLAREEEVAREWQWLHDALNEVARARAERGDAAAFRLMQQQALVSDHLSNGEIISSGRRCVLFSPPVCFQPAIMELERPFHGSSSSPPEGMCSRK
jgi:hypothetical protein